MQWGSRENAVGSSGNAVGEQHEHIAGQCECSVNAEREQWEHSGML